MLLRLNCIDAVAVNSELSVDRFPASIGRGTEADITIKDIWASRVHCHIRCENGLLMVKDLGSRNGTRVNGVPIDESPLRHGDELTVGISTFLVLLAHVTGGGSSIKIGDSARAVTA
jgi:pSer/pThr/pTyr-binding forkhead associated (FHA) protein